MRGAVVVSGRTLPLRQHAAKAVTAVTAVRPGKGLLLTPSPQNADETASKESSMRVHRTKLGQRVLAVAFNVCIVSFVGLIFAHSYAPYFA
jgi:hypothetical protein